MTDPEMSEKEATELMEKAEKKLARLKVKGFFLSMFGIRHNYTELEAIIECYHQSGTMFKIAKQWKSAGEAFAKAGELNLKNRDSYSAASNYANAANCFKLIKIKDAVTYFNKSIKLYLELGDISSAARTHLLISEVLQAAGDLEGAIHHFERAADYFEIEDLNSDGNTAFFNAAQMENYAKAIKLFEDLAISVLENNLRSPQNRYLFRASVCHLCDRLLRNMV